MKKLVYPFTFEEWKKHPSSREKIKWCKSVAKKIKVGKQLKLNL